VTKSLKLAMAAFAAFAVNSAPTMADNYFAGKTITVQVPSGSGGTYHVYCQLVQRNIGKYIPGSPNTLIQNMPGAGGAKSASYMANVAPKGGEMIAMIAPGVITTQLVRNVRYDSQKFNWLGAPAARAAGIFYWHTAGVTKLQDILDKQTTIASSGFASSGSIFPRLVNATLGAKMKIILGYKGGGAMNLSVEKEETMGRNNFLSGFTGVRPTWLPQKKIIPIIMYGPRTDSQYVQGVPHLGDLLKPGTDEYAMFKVLNTNLEVGQAFYVPPGAPKRVTKILETAFVKMMYDPKFKENVLKRRVEHAPVSAQQIRKLIKQGFEAATPDVLNKIKQRLYTKAKS
jgi:tripartite-type tricarboxylate transporter receptor subunit TctC